MIPRRPRGQIIFPELVKTGTVRLIMSTHSPQHRFLQASLPHLRLHPLPVKKGTQSRRQHELYCGARVLALEWVSRLWSWRPVEAGMCRKGSPGTRRDTCACRFPASCSKFGRWPFQHRLNSLLPVWRKTTDHRAACGSQIRPLVTSWTTDWTMLVIG